MCIDFKLYLSPPALMLVICAYSDRRILKIMLADRLVRLISLHRVTAAANQFAPTIEEVSM